MSDKIKILDASLTELAVISAAGSALRTERINADNTLTFTARIKNGYGAYITDTSVFELNGDYYDIAFYKKEQQGDGSLIVSVEAEHVSYRLNDPDYDLEYYTAEATPAAILAGILSGTGFTVGTVEFTSMTAFSLQEKTSRRGLLMQFTAYLGGELEYSGFTVSLLTQRGSSTPKALKVGKDITVISKAVDKRRYDASGNPTVSYTCGVYKGTSIALGDVVTLDYDALDIDATLRVVGKSYDPYNPNRVTVEIGNYINSLEDDLYRIETSTVAKDKVYNGTRIGPEYGFEAVRSDKKARAYFRSDGMRFQSGDSSGSNWTDKLYYDYDSETGNTELYFAGKLTAEVIEALSAVITPNLYAGKATVAELTVDQLDTSDMVKNYLAGKKDPVKYIRVYDQNVEFHLAKTTGNSTEQAVDRNGGRLYWTDETHTASTTEDTGLPVMQYVYETDQVKLKFSFEYSSESSEDEPMLVLGVGTGESDNGRAFIWKKTTGLAILQKNSAGNNVEIDFTPDGIVCSGNTGAAGIRNIYIGSGPPNPQHNDLRINTNA